MTVIWKIRSDVSTSANIRMLHLERTYKREHSVNEIADVEETANEEAGGYGYWSPQQANKWLVNCSFQLRLNHHFPVDHHHNAEIMTIFIPTSVLSKNEDSSGLQTIGVYDDGEYLDDYFELTKRDLEPVYTDLRSVPSFLRFGRNMNNPVMRSVLEPNFIRFGRNSPNFLRFGRAAAANFLRFGRASPNFLRFGKANPNFLRFGRDSDLNRHYRAAPNFLRFG
ncbi:FMRFamide-related neuropeptide [Trichinella spiralis]|uniref:FMRFamide-related neuropeptide n=1 Tax=Trichinella spiralis TaxID=6334 RepID=UPI0001EFCBBC|nr:FMRFamide-related neuropeptide [Trichinella spiralis]